jgi:hypothetical protein
MKNATMTVCKMLYFYFRCVLTMAPKLQVLNIKNGQAELLSLGSYCPMTLAFLVLDLINIFINIFSERPTNEKEHSATCELRYTEEIKTQ